MVNGIAKNSLLIDLMSNVVQVEPMRVMAASPSSILGGADSWASDESSTAHRTLPTIKAEVDNWTRRIHQQTIDNCGESSGRISPVSAAPAAAGSNRRSLRHAASHPSSREDGSPASSSAVSKKRLDWRNSHRNYRSAPTTAASRDSYALHYESRRALRDYHQHSIEAVSVYTAAISNRRMLPKRGGSMRETIVSSQDSSSSAAAVELTGTATCIPPTIVAQQRCQMMASPATKRWRCHTVDCPCSNNVTALSHKDRILEGALAHRHSFPSSDDLASPSSYHRRHYHRDDDQRNRFG